MTESKRISIVIPVFNEADGLARLHGELAAACDGTRHEFEFLFVNDGSTDDTLGRLRSLREADPRVRIVDLARNFGQHPALTAGIDRAGGDAVILMDGDLEDRPADIWALIEVWETGQEVVYALRGRRQVGLLKRAAFRLHHLISGRLESALPAAGAFSLLDRTVISALRGMPERNRYLPGLRTWAGFRQQGVTLDRGERYDDTSRVSNRRLLGLAVRSYVSFSKVPLRLASLAGVFLSLVGFVGMAYIIIYQLTRGFAVDGWSSLMVTLLFVSGIQLLCLGIVGEYIGQILDEAKRRPIYLVREEIGLDGRAEGTEDEDGKRDGK